MFRKLLSSFLLSFFVLSASAFAVTVATPVIFPNGGAFINTVVVGVITTTSSAVICYTLDGSTPTAATPGTCDNNGSIFTGANTNSEAWAQIAAASTTLKAIGTAAGDTNSAVATSSAFTITSQAATNPVSAPTPVKITNASGSIVDTEPFLVSTPHGLFVFYSEGTAGLPTDGGGLARVMFKISNDGGQTWSTPTSVSCPAGDPATGCLYDDAAQSTANIASGGGYEAASGTLILLMPQWTQGPLTVQGVTKMLGTWNGSAWTWSSPVFLTTPSESTANEFDNPTANLISIPSGSSGVTGSCVSGCSFIPVLGINGGATGLIFTYDHGANWSDPLTIPQTWPFSTEEKAVIWLGGMNLLMFSRPSWTFQSQGGAPQNMVVQTSSNLGTSWNSYVADGNTFYGGPSNLPIGPCAVGPQTNWNDSPTRPSVAVDPANANLATLMWGQRFTCNGVSKYQWKIVTFGASSAFTNAGLNLPFPQTLALDPVTTAQPHTTYSYLVALNSTQLLMTFEQGNTTTSEDIYTVILSYPAGQSVSGNVSFSGGTSLR